MELFLKDQQLRSFKALKKEIKFLCYLGWELNFFPFFSSLFFVFLCFLSL